MGANSLRVLHILGGALGSGAGRGALTLHLALRARGVDSRILGRVERRTPPDYHAVRLGGVARLITSVRTRIYSWRLSRNIVDRGAPYFPIGVGLNPHKHPLYSWADIIHIQWAHASTMGPEFWEVLAKEDRPVVFTLRDMWLFTGGCHFSSGCSGYLDGCQSCPILKPEAHSVASDDLARKRRTYTSGMAFIAISKDVAQNAQLSTALAKHKIRVISNAIPIDKFAIIDKFIARDTLGLDSSKYVIGIGAIDLSDPRKGGDIIPRLLEEFSEHSDVEWAVFGGNFSYKNDNIRYFGMVKDYETLNMIYSAADLFVMPSLHETFGKTTAEAMAAGTPVVAFASTPAQEIIEESVTGWTVPHNDVESLVTKIRNVMAMDRGKLRAMGVKGREAVTKRYSPDVAALEHIKLYCDLLGLADES
ncbi:glycosyltransferase [Mesorhizobium delmotii]|uniref:Putative glucosyltransferase n=1 Tax=Mesorhizobium delmotii TaxID=1631247 RepID=A0A2P9AF30_9HYPH|nr:glycosyltransferase [Mesorhizobium delmotii]SJM29732.1 putative glucosyltransferase [Mesorhizobium delmotii]